MMTALVVDDDASQRRLLRQKLGIACADMIEVIGEAFSLKSAVKQIEALQPELVFLDIELTESDTGFDVLEEFDDPTFGVIFVTAYPDYAAKAYNYDPINFLVKPVQEDRLRKSVERAWRIIRGSAFVPTGLAPAKTAFEALLSESLPPSSLVLPTNETSNEAIIFKNGYEEIILVPKYIIYCQAQGNYTEIFYQTDTNVRAHVLRQTLKDLHNDMRRAGLVRVHRSFMVNLDYLERAEKDKRSYLLQLRSGEKIQMSESYKVLIDEVLQPFWV
jgi:two-component system LytT family response regulator